ncbi:hypothetical protein [Leisingera sp. McT4-56]|uniref:hypothetical protein n=1 Tax=Leisingera sp. McT4-56 TaxID=2881255 RepID=UPI001CF8E9C1|nr:hypothetical protein [Leisingera sp. McT4-56]MCB4458039.1 hypothetical protein [Leisingera sp. McT4-56]
MPLARGWDRLSCVKARCRRRWCRHFASLSGAGVVSGTDARLNLGLAGGMTQSFIPKRFDRRATGCDLVPHS